MPQPLSSIPAGALKAVSGENPAEDEYQSALNEITSALQARVSNNPQQILLGIAQGMLTPGPTGSFGESLGHAAGNVSKLQQNQDAAILENAKMRLQVAQAKREQAQKNEGLKILEQLDAGGAGQGGAQITKGDDSGFGVMIGGNEITPKLIRNMLVRNPEIGKALQAQYELTLKGIQTQQGGAYNILTGKYTPFGGKALVSRNIPGRGVVDMPEQDAMDLDEARRNNNISKFNEIVKRNTMPMTEKSAQGEGKEAPSGVEKPVTPMTKASIEAQQALLKAEGEEAGRSRAKQTSAVRDAGKAATGLLPIYARAESILNRPGLDFNRVMGVLEKGGALDAIGSLVEEAVKVGNFSIGIPAIRKIIGESGAPPELIAAAAELGQVLAMTQFEQRKGLGSGTSVSNFEQMMVNNMGPTMRDTLMAFKPKLQFMKNKAEFDKDLAKALRASGMQYEDFEDTKKFQDMFNDYKEKQMSIAYGSNAVNAPAGSNPSAAPKPGAQQGSISAADLKARLKAKQ